MLPLVVVHDLNSGVRGVALKMRDAKLAVELDVPKPPAKNLRRNASARLTWSGRDCETLRPKSGFSWF